MNLTIDKPRITTITTIEIVISKQSEQESKLQEIKEKILNSEKGSKIRLILKTIAEDDAAMLKLQTQFFIYFSKYITYLEWKISGNFFDNGQAQAIGNILKRLVNLYSLDLSIYSSKFGDKGAVSLAAGLSKLKNLHVLKLFSDFEFCPITTKGLQYISNAISIMPELEILKQNFLYDNFPFPPKLGGLHIYLDQFIYDTSKYKLLQSIFDRKNVIVEIILDGSRFFFDEWNEVDKAVLNCTPLKKLITELFEFPYLTKFKHDQYTEGGVSKELDKIFNLEEELEKLLYERYKMLLNILAINLVISELLPFNPQLIFVDMIFD